MNNSTPARQLHSALFIDFDNIYISLEEQDPQLAEKFASDPERWLAWLENKLSSSYQGDFIRRRTLIRKCYMNPQKFANYRPYLITTAFEVVDCPPLTARGKTSTDIHMVMGILDALNHPFHFDEFIIFSGDADFTPVMLKLREHGRYSVAISAGYVSPAYKAACDLLITPDTFAREALGIRDVEEAPAPPSRDKKVDSKLLAKIATRLYDAASSPDGIQASDLPAIYKEFPEFKQSQRWLGFSSLRGLTQALINANANLSILEEDPWRVVRNDQAKSFAEIEVNIPENAQVGDQQNTVRTAIGKFAQIAVRSSEEPVHMGALAQAIQERFGKHLAGSNWLGAGTFKSLLKELDLPSLRISTFGAGFVYDIGKHTAPENAGQPEPDDKFAAQYPDLATLAQKINRLTDAPYLSPEHYALMLEEIARAVNEEGYNLTKTSKTVRDRCVEKEAPIARSHVNFALIGISYSGHRFGRKTDNARELGERLATNILNLCNSNQLPLSDDEKASVRQWIVGKLPEA
jgi:uncharacterized LabA/DUF88 family protein